MAPATYLAVLFCAALAAASVSAETLEEGKSLGQSLGASGAQQAPSVTESSATINSTLGHESTQGAGSGAGYDRGYTGAATYTGKLACAEGRTAFFGGLGLRVASCTVAGGHVTQLSLEACTSARDGVACQWSAPKTVLNPGSTSFGGFAVNLTCPAGGGVCDITVRETASQTWNADTLAEQGRQAAQAEGTGGFYDTMNTTYNDGGYRASLSAVGPQYSGCVEQVDTGLASDGIVYSCDGLQNASFDSACEETRECLRTEQQITRYDVDCVSGVDLVEQSCTTVTPTKDCTVSIEKQTYSCNKTLNVTVTITKNCTPGIWLTGGQISLFKVDYYCDPGAAGTMFNFYSPISNIPALGAKPTFPRSMFYIPPDKELYISQGITYNHIGTTTVGLVGFASGWHGCSPDNTCRYTFKVATTTSFSYPLGCSPHDSGLFHFCWSSRGSNTIFAPQTIYAINPGVITIHEQWDDGCTTYENAK